MKVLMIQLVLLAQDRYSVYTRDLRFATSVLAYVSNVFVDNSLKKRFHLRLPHKMGKLIMARVFHRM